MVDQIPPDAKPAESRAPISGSPSAAGHPPGRLAIFLHGFEEGGAQRRMLQLAGELARRGMAVELVVVDPDGPLAGHVPPEVPVAVVGGELAKLPWIRGKRRRRVRAAVPALVSYLRRQRPNIFMAGANHAALAAIWAHQLTRCPDVKLVVRVSNALSGQSLSSRLRRQAVRHFYSKADHLVAVSQAMAEELRQVAPRLGGRISVMPNPVIDDRFDSNAGAEIAAPWFSPGPPLVLSVGRLAEQKDYPTLLRAIAAVRRARPVRLAILGEGPERNRLNALASALGIGADVALPGRVANPLPFMRKAAVFTLTSEREGISGALIEAMACGCPVVSTRCTGSIELLDDGRLAPLVDIGDAEGLARAIAAILDAPPDTGPLRARAQQFTVRAAGDAYLALFSRLVRA